MLFKVYKNTLMVWASLVYLAIGPAQAGLQQGLTLQVQGITRTFDLYLPDQPGKKPMPLVLMFHGHSGDSDVMTGANKRRAPYKVWLRLAQQHRFAVAIPNGEIGPDKMRGWNDCRADSTTNPKTDDVAFVLALLDHIESLTPVDKSRVYATGTSNGGNMVLRLAMEVPQRFAAVGAVVAAMPKHNGCEQHNTPISVLFMNGTEDPLLPYGGGLVGREKDGRGETASAEASVKYWLAVNHIDTQPEVYEFPNVSKKDRSSVVRYRYAKQNGGPEVVLYEVRGGGHTEPSRSEHYRRLYKLIVGKQNYDIEMAEEIWGFFQNQRR
jgi:polyhydroxybutyrate depolymerase